MEIRGCHLPQVYDACEGDGEWERISVNLSVPVKAKRDS